ncbi:MAG: PEGA domain-containing protein, partial [Myxococcales bacterium]|nr:PEGA domain-containing protein [Myxococcales bacterium]
VVVRQDGYNPVEQWFDLTRGQTESWSVELGIPNQGTILVTADVENAEVFLDGVSQGMAPLVLEGVPIGEREVELRAPDRRPYRVPVVVEPGEQATVAARITMGYGQLQIIGNIDGAVVQLNGEVVGETPLLLQEVRVGPHILEIEAEGYEPLNETIEVVGGMRRVLGIRLEPGGVDESQLGQRLIVTSNVDGAQVFVDGEVAGAAPIALGNLAVGTYDVEVRAADYETYRTRCVITAGRACTRNAVMFPSGGRLELSSNVEGAVLLIDGRQLGPLPYDGGIPAGTVEISVEAPGYLPWSREVVAEPGQPLNLQAQLVAESERPRSLLAHSAFTVPAEMMTLDLSAGWPVFLEVRFDRGILDNLDAGAALRSFGRLTELEGRARYAYPILDYLVVGGSGKIGGGWGPGGVSSFFILAEANTTVHLHNRLSATLIQGID